MSVTDVGSISSEAQTSAVACRCYTNETTLYSGRRLEMNSLPVFVSHRSNVTRSVCLSVSAGHVHEPFKNGSADRDAVLGG